MNEDELQRLLAEAFEAKAQASVGDDRRPPVRRPAARPTRRPVRWLAPVAAAAAVVAVVGGAIAVAHLSSGPSPHPAAAGRPSTAPVSASPSGSTAPTGESSTVAAPALPAPTVQASSVGPTAAATAVSIKLDNVSGEQVGVGMPVVAHFSRTITDASALAQATRVLVNGAPVKAAWYFERATTAGYPIVGHLRAQTYWPAHSSVQVELPVAGLSAGTGLTYADDVTLEFATGAANVATVDDATHRLKLVSDGRPDGVYPVSLGAPSTPTMSGTKVIMAKGTDVCVSGPGYNICNVKYTQRLTTSGEFLLAAPWNKQIGQLDTSNGCTNFTTADARKLYSVLEVGDVVTFDDTSGATMNMAEGYGDWNIPWAQWLTGGAVPTS